LIGSDFGAIMPQVGSFLPIPQWIQRASSLPAPDLEEQAIAAPGASSTAIIVFLTAWDELLFAWIVSVQAIAVGMRRWAGGGAHPNAGAVN